MTKKIQHLFPKNTAHVLENIIFHSLTDIYLIQVFFDTPGYINEQNKMSVHIEHYGVELDLTIVHSYCTLAMS